MKDFNLKTFFLKKNWIQIQLLSGVSGMPDVLLDSSNGDDSIYIPETPEKSDLNSGSLSVGLSDGFPACQHF